MGVFRLHEHLIEDCSALTRSFVEVENKRIGEEVDVAIEEGLLWPDPNMHLTYAYSASMLFPSGHVLLHVATRSSRSS